MKRERKQWLRAGLLVAILMTIALLPRAPAVTQAQGGGTISYGAKVFGTIAEDAPRLTYSFEGSMGDVVTVIADNWTGTLDLRAELIAPNGVILASSAQNTLDDNMQGAYLSAILLGGLVLNALFGWWWADPAAALAMAPIIAREGVEALRGKVCADCG